MLRHHKEEHHQLGKAGWQNVATVSSSGAWKERKIIKVKDSSCNLLVLLNDAKGEPTVLEADEEPGLSQERHDLQLGGSIGHSACGVSLEKDAHLGDSIKYQVDVRLNLPVLAHDNVGNGSEESVNWVEDPGMPTLQLGSGLLCMTEQEESSVHSGGEKSRESGYPRRRVECLSEVKQINQVDVGLDLPGLVLDNLGDWPAEIMRRVEDPSLLLSHSGLICKSALEEAHVPVGGVVTRLIGHSQKSGVWLCVVGWLELSKCN